MRQYFGCNLLILFSYSIILLTSVSQHSVIFVASLIEHLLYLLVVNCSCDVRTECSALLSMRESRGWGCTSCRHTHTHLTQHHRTSALISNDSLNGSRIFSIVVMCEKGPYHWCMCRILRFTPNASTPPTQRRQCRFRHHQED